MTASASATAATMITSRHDDDTSVTARLGVWVGIEPAKSGSPFHNRSTTAPRTRRGPSRGLSQFRGYGVVPGVAVSGRYWARTIDPQLVELVLTGRFAGLFSAVGKDLGKSHTGEGGFRRSRADVSRTTPRPGSIME